MNTQLNRPLSIAVLQTRNGEVPGFEDLYLLTCRNTLADIRVTVSDEEKVWSIFREVYKQIWERRESIPEAGIIRPWIRVLLKEEARKQGVVIEEFAAETDREPVKVPDEKATSALLRIEEELELLSLPEEITGKKRAGSMPVAVLRLLFSLVGLGVAAAAAVFLLQPVRKSAETLRPTEGNTPTQQAIQVDAEGENEEPEILYGWNETREGRRYRDADGSFRESSFLEDGDSLYYMDENGYAATGSRQFGNQNFVFDDDGALKIIGPEQTIRQAKSVINNLLELSVRGNKITEQNVDYALALSFRAQEGQILEIDKDVICRTVDGKPVKPKTVGQKNYVDSIRKKMIVFGIGPAGTGKTYLAMAMAIQAFKTGEVNRIILTRPAIEAGEKLGFLPGDLQSKIDPYLRPLYDALYQIMGADSYLHNAEKGLIEVAPLAYMRGRTLDNAYIILDEAQNTTPAQMKMFLTRIGFGSKVIITGDRTQKDLPADAVSGLDVAIRVLKGISDIGFCTLSSEDVVRHPLVQKIVEAYDRYERHTDKEKKEENDDKHRVRSRRETGSGLRKDHK